jgi:hypothetical protein
LHLEGQSIGVPELLQLDTCRGELRLDEAGSNSRFLYIIGAKLDLGGSCHRDGLTIVNFRHVLRKFKRRGSPRNGREFFPRRMKERRSHCEMRSTKKMAHKNKANKTGWSA